MDWTKERIQKNILNSDLWVIRSLLALYQCQTDSEKNSDVTKSRNGIGFNSVDSNFLSSCSKQVLERDPKILKRTHKDFINVLSTKQMTLIRNKLLKYSSQLSSIANGTSNK